MKTNNLTWDAIVLPYEELLEDIISDIEKMRKIDGTAYMTGNGVIKKKVKGGYTIQCDDGSKIFVPYSNYKGWQDSQGTRVQTNMNQTRKNRQGRVLYLDSMECVSFDELKYRMFVSLEDGNMIYAATCAWAIYENAPDDLMEKMKNCIHQIRNTYKAYKKGLLKEKSIAA